MMSYKVLHVGKVKMSGVGGMANHLEKREKVRTNEDIDLERSAENYAIDGMTADHLAERVARVRRNSVKRKVRPDAVGLDDVIVGASHDWMMSASKDERDAYFHDSLHWLQKRYGAENVMYAVVHMDETTPHMHVGVVPIRDGCLSSKKVFDKREIGKLHDDFTRDVASRYGLERGGDRGGTSLETSALKEKTKQDAAMGAVAAETMKKTAHEARFKPTWFGLSKDRDKVEMPTKAFKIVTKGAAANAELAAQTAAAMVAKQAAETRAKVAEERAKRAERIVKEQEAALRSARAFLDAPEDVRREVETMRREEITYQQNVQRLCVRTFLQMRRDFAGTVAAMSSRLDGIGIKGAKAQRAYVAACLSEARKQGKAAFRRTKAGGWEPRSKDWTPPQTSGGGGGGGSSWQAPPKDCNFLAKLADPNAVPIAGKLGEVPWDELTPSEKAEKQFWEDMNI